MVTDELACSIVFTRLAEYDCHLWGYVLDGFPRSVPQAQRLDVWLAEGHERLCAVVYLDASDEEIVKRTVARRQCEECETIYNLEFNPPPDPTRCNQPDCPGRLVQRDDDTEETIRERLRIFHETTQPLLNYYEEQDLLQRVPGCGMTPDNVQKKIEEALATLGAV
jgi:adenylate kinase